MSLCRSLGFSPLKSRIKICNRCELSEQCIHFKRYLYSWSQLVVVIFINVSSIKCHEQSSAPSAWTNLQNSIKSQELITAHKLNSLTFQSFILKCVNVSVPNHDCIRDLLFCVWLNKSFPSSEWDFSPFFYVLGASICSEEALLAKDL